MKSTVDTWNAVTKERQAEKKKPQEEVAALHDRFLEEAVRKILDLGCGSGRHLVYFAKLGYEVAGIDLSPEAINLSRKWLDEEGLKADLQCQDMRQLPWPDNFFDAVFTVQVIEHNRLERIQEIIQEVGRAIRGGGLFFATVKKYPPRTDWKDGKFSEVDRHLYAPTQGTEKGVLHYFFTEAELRGLLAGFDVIDIKADRKGEHYCILSRR